MKHTDDMIQNLSKGDYALLDYFWVPLLLLCFAVTCGFVVFGTHHELMDRRHVRLVPITIKDGRGTLKGVDVSKVPINIERDLFVSSTFYQRNLLSSHRKSEIALVVWIEREWSDLSSRDPFVGRPDGIVKVAGQWGVQRHILEPDYPFNEKRGSLSEVFDLEEQHIGIRNYVGWRVFNWIIARAADNGNFFVIDPNVGSQTSSFGVAGCLQLTERNNSNSQRYQRIKSYAKGGPFSPPQNIVIVLFAVALSGLILFAKGIDGRNDFLLWGGWIAAAIGLVGGLFISLGHCSFCAENTAVSSYFGASATCYRRVEDFRVGNRAA